MKVNITKNEKDMEFGDVELGGVFLYGDKYFMKIQSSEVKNSAFPINAVNLETGKAERFAYSYTKVTILHNAELIGEVK